MVLSRKPTVQEERLIEFLVEKSSSNFTKDWKDDLLVRPMDDGEMGSLYLFPKGIDSEDRVFGKQISDYQFTDIDGVDVVVSLNVDSDGNLFELDIWKTNYEQLMKIPDI